MKKSRISDEQLVKILYSVTGGTTVRVVCQSHGVSENTVYTWKRKLTGMESDDIRKLIDLQSENQTLKQIVVGQALLIEASESLYQKNGLRPQAEERGPASCCPSAFLNAKRITSSELDGVALIYH